jgi:hypothetical protein
MADRKLVDETHKIPDRRINGLLRREIWVDRIDGSITRYDLAYINNRLYTGDNGRVFGYDNAQDGHHRHFFGQVEPAEFVSFEAIEQLFQRDWRAVKDSK